MARTLEELDVLVRQLQGLVVQLQGLVAGLGGAAAAGSGTLTYNASSMSDPTTVTHGLGVVPEKIVALQQYDGDGRHAALGAFNLTDTTFDIEGRDWAGAGVTKTTTFWWVAVG